MKDSTNEKHLTDAEPNITDKKDSWRWIIHSPLHVALLTAAVAILGHLVLAFFDHYGNLELEKHRLQQQLLVDALNVPDEDEAEGNLLFLIRVGLVVDSNEDFKIDTERIRKYILDKNNKTPVFGPYPPILSQVSGPQGYESTDDLRYCKRHLKYGNPSNSSDFICRLGFALSYDSILNIPRWVSYRLLDIPRSSRDRKRPRFRSDPVILESLRISSVFRGSGFNRGQLVPSGDVNWNPNSAQEARFFSNVAPQYPEFDRGIWSRLEKAIRGWVEERDMLFIIAGPVVNSNNVRKIDDFIAIPDQYFKVVFDPVDQISLAFLIPHSQEIGSSKELEKFLVSIDEIEELTGFDLLSELLDDEENEIENKPADTLWQ